MMRTLTLGMLLGALFIPASAAASEPVQLDARIEGTQAGERARINLGDKFELVLTVTRPSKAQIFVPTSPDLSPFRLLEYVPPSTAQKTSATEEHRYRLIALRLGSRRLPSVELTYRLEDGTAGALRTQKFRVMVAGHLLNEPDAELAPPPSPLPIQATNWGLLWLLSVVGAAFVAALLTLLVLRLLRDRLIAGAETAPSIPPNELALQKLRLIGASELEAADRYAETIDVLREYLGGRFRFDGLESTTSELMVHLEGCDMTPESQGLISRIVEEADLIKFAQLTPGDDDATQVIAQVEEVVVSTWIEPDPEEVAEERARLEPASKEERLKGGLLDAIFFGLPCTGLIIGLYFMEELQWGWLAILAFCLLMLGRDLFGGGSPGKKLLGIRLANRDSQQGLPSLERRLGRNLLLLLAPIGLPVETLILAYNPVTERLGDRWFRTEVVRRAGYQHQRGGGV
jgi:uncharacterized RDD family membrane protein YckC